MSRFTETLVVTPLPDGKTWIILSDFGYEVGCEGSGEVIDVPIGTHTDFTSVPRLLWWIFPRWGKYGNAAVLHDWLYWEQSRSRREADDIMFEAMGVLGVSPWQKYPIYLAVRTFGFLAWWGNQSRKAGQKQRFGG